MLLAVSACGSPTKTLSGGLATASTTAPIVTVVDDDSGSSTIVEAPATASSVASGEPSPPATSAEPGSSSTSSTTAATTTTTTSTASTVPVTTSTSVVDTTAASAGTGTVTVRIESIDGYLIEGFEVGLRFETLKGAVIATALWTDFVQSLGQPGIDPYYTSVMSQQVPAGQIVVLASVNPGLGPPPVVPDVNGVLRCRLVVDVAGGGQADVEVLLSQNNSCLHAI